MKEVNYICEDVFQISKTTNAVLQMFNNLNFIGNKAFGNGSTGKETHIYFDRPDRGDFSRSLEFFGGFLRLIIKKRTENDIEYYVDYKSCSSSETKRFVVNRIVSATEIAKAVHFRGKLVPVVELDCENFHYYLQGNNGSVVDLILQDVKIKGGNNFEDKQIAFLSLKDKTKLKCGKIAPCTAKEIENVFTEFYKLMNKQPLNQVHFSKYQTIIDLIPQLSAKTEVEPF